MEIKRVRYLTHRLLTICQMKHRLVLPLNYNSPEFLFAQLDLQDNFLTKISLKWCLVREWTVKKSSLVITLY